MNVSPFSGPIFLGTQKREALLPRRAGALWEGPVPFRRNRESRSREAAGRRNWPEAVPRKMRAEKGRLSKISENRDKEQTWAKQLARTTRNARRPSDQRASPSVRGCSRRGVTPQRAAPTPTHTPAGPGAKHPPANLSQGAQ